MEQRMIELEKRVAFQDLAIQELNATVTEQYKRLEVLERRLKQLQDKQDSGDLVKDQQDEEPPPHY
jgi:SlyX protein